MPCSSSPDRGCLGENHRARCPRQTSPRANPQADAGQKSAIFARIGALTPCPRDVPLQAVPLRQLRRPRCPYHPAPNLNADDEITLDDGCRYRVHGCVPRNPERRSTGSSPLCRSKTTEPFTPSACGRMHECTARVCPQAEWNRRVGGHPSSTSVQHPRTTEEAQRSAGLHLVGWLLPSSAFWWRYSSCRLAGGLSLS